MKLNDKSITFVAMAGGVTLLGAAAAMFAAEHNEASLFAHKATQEAFMQALAQVTSTDGKSYLYKGHDKEAAELTAVTRKVLTDNKALLEIANKGEGNKLAQNALVDESEKQIGLTLRAQYKAAYAAKAHTLFLGDYLLESEAETMPNRSAVELFVRSIGKQVLYPQTLSFADYVERTLQQESQKVDQSDPKPSRGKPHAKAAQNSL